MVQIWQAELDDSLCDSIPQWETSEWYQCEPEHGNPACGTPGVEFRQVSCSTGNEAECEQIKTEPKPSDVESVVAATGNDDDDKPVVMDVAATDDDHVPVVVEDVAEPAPSTLTQPSTSAEPVATPPTPLTSEEDSLLRSFDLCEAYGPSLGLSRKERWQRAEGASPPGLHSAPRQRISSNRPLARACAALTGRLRTGAACERVDGPRAGGGQHARRGVGALAVRHPRECVRAWPGGAGGPLVQ